MALKSKLLDLNDFEKIGMVAKHCNYIKLDIAINEAMEFDLRKLICGLFWEVKNVWEQSFYDDFEDEKWDSLINGSDYTGCNDVQKQHRGLKTLLTYYAYSRYLVLNGFDDTANGVVQKTNQFSLPKPLKEVQSFSDKYRAMALNVWDDIQDFICVNKSDYPNANVSDCNSCGCGSDDCGDDRVTKGFGMTGSNITKYGV